MTLVRWIGGQSFTGAAEASYALEHGVAPVPSKPLRPERPRRVYQERQSDGTFLDKSRTNEEHEDLKFEYQEDRFKYEIEIKQYDKQAEVWKQNAPKMYHIILQHCSKELETKLKALKDWETVKANQDVLKLMEHIKSIAHQHNETKQGTMALVE